MSIPSLAPPTDPLRAAAILEVAIGQIEFARAYVKELLDATPRHLWHVIPPGASSSIAWQVGHLAVSEYGLLMFRQRGREPEDLELVPGRFRKQFGRGTRPADLAADAPTAAELVERLDAVHAQALQEITEANPLRLLQASEMPYAVFPTKLGAILFCPLHEQLHAGQIGALRRAHQLEPIR